MDDWETFSASPYQQQEQGAPGPTGPADIEDLLHLSFAYLGATFDWIDNAGVTSATLLGGKQVWFDMLEALRIGMTGAQIENTLNDKGITVRAKTAVPLKDGLAAVVVVDADKEQQTQKLFAGWGILL